MVLAEGGRSVESLPKDLAAAIESGRVPAVIVERFLELEKSAVWRWLLQFGGFKERLLADDLFMAKVAMECGVGIFTKVFIFLFFLHPILHNFILWKIRNTIHNFQIWFLIIFKKSWIKILF